MGPELLYLLVGVLFTIYAPDAKQFVCENPPAIIQPQPVENGK